MLTINHGTFNSFNQDACDSYYWIGNEYNTSGTYTHSYINDSGCHSVDTLILSIHPSYHTAVFDTACDSYLWYDSLYTVSTTSPQYVEHSSFGCDSILQLHLTIYYSYYDTVVATATNSYYWNGQTYTQSGEYYCSGQTSNGCDSIIVLQLTINDGIGVPDEVVLSEVTLYPNPTTGQLTISADDVIKVEVFDRLGRRVAAFHNTNVIDISHLPAGSYTLRLFLTQGNVVRRVVKR